MQEVQTLLRSLESVFQVNLEHEVTAILSRVNKATRTLLKRHNISPRSAHSLNTKLSSTLIPFTVTYKQTPNAAFHQKLELIQHNAPPVIARPIRCTSKEKLYQELGLEL